LWLEIVSIVAWCCERETIVGHLHLDIPV